MDRDTITIPMRTLKAMISWQHNPNNPVASFYAQMRDYHNLDFDGTVYIVPHTKQELSAPQRWCPSGFCYCSREIELAEALAMVRDE